MILTFLSLQVQTLSRRHVNALQLLNKTDRIANREDYLISQQYQMLTSYVKVDTFRTAKIPNMVHSDFEKTFGQFF